MHRSDQLLVYEHSQFLRYVRIHQIRQRAVVGSSSNRQSAISQCSLGYSLHIACFTSSFSLFLPSWSVHREKCSTLPPLQWFHPAFAPVSMFTTNSDICLFLFSVLHLRRRLDSTDVRSLGHLVVECRDPSSVEHQSCKLAMLL